MNPKAALERNRVILKPPTLQKPNYCFNHLRDFDHKPACWNSIHFYALVKPFFRAAKLPAFSQTGKQERVWSVFNQNRCRVQRNVLIAFMVPWSNSETMSHHAPFLTSCSRLTQNNNSMVRKTPIKNRIKQWLHPMIPRCTHSHLLLPENWPATVSRCKCLPGVHVVLTTLGNVA